MRKLLLRNLEDLEWYERWAIGQWLGFHPALKEMYEFKEAMRRFYRIRGYKRAGKEEIVNYRRFNGISNGRLKASTERQSFVSAALTDIRSSKIIDGKGFQGRTHYDSGRAA